MNHAITLQSIAARVDALAAMPGVRSWFDRRISDWCFDQLELRQVERSPQPCHIVPLSARAYSLPEKICLLARVHDLMFIGTDLVGLSDSLIDDPADFGWSFAYFKSCEHAKQLTDADAEALQRFIVDVENVVCAELKLSPASPSVPDPVSIPIPVLSSPDALLTEEQAAELAHCSARTIRRLIRAGRLDATDYGTGKHHNYRISPSALARLNDPQPKPARQRRSRRQFASSASLDSLLPDF
jgi:excisionase family DNA binding protein